MNHEDYKVIQLEKNIYSFLLNDLKAGKDSKGSSILKKLNVKITKIFTS